MRFWDTSAITPLLVEEPDTFRRERELAEDPRMLIWFGTPVELESALTRRLREGSLSREGESLARARLADLAQSWVEIEPLAVVRDRALRLLRVHPLRAADAMQLAAALVACHERTGLFGFLSGDARLLEAARLEGFAVQ